MSVGLLALFSFLATQGDSMADDFEIRVAALNAAVDLHETGADAEHVLESAEKFLPFLNGGLPVEAPAVPVADEAHVEAPVPADPITEETSAEEVPAAA
jgi:hypothetical protein